MPFKKRRQADRREGGRFLEQGCSQVTTQGGSGKGGVCGPAADGDYDDGGLDRRELGDGQSAT